MPPRPFFIVQTTDQWLRSGHEHTWLETDTDILRLADAEQPLDVRPISAPRPPGGLAFDAECCLYHGIAEQPPAGDTSGVSARIERILWATLSIEEREHRTTDVQSLFDQPFAAGVGQFETTATPGLRDPRALAVDADDRLFIADGRLREVIVADLWRRRIIRHVRFSSPDGTPARPVDVVSRGRDVWVLLDDAPGLMLLRARRSARRFKLPETADDHPSRIAMSRTGTLVVLDRAGEKTRITWFNADDPDSAHTIDVPNATDIEFDEADSLVIARRPGEEFLRYTFAPQVAEQSSLKAVDYDGAGIVRTPDGRIGYWATAGGFRHAVAARPRFVRDGRVHTYRLDSGNYQTVWGRLFLDACMPDGTDVTFTAIACDEPPDGLTLPATPPVNIPTPKVHRPSLSPPLLPLELDIDRTPQPLFRRPTGRELAWARQPADDPFETYEAPIVADRGRFLWITLELRGNGRRTPRIRSLRVEPAHDYLRRLPVTFSRDAEAESFLRRLLAPMEGLFGELEAQALARMVLVDARSSPAEVLPWLAGFVGLLLDERLSAARRRLLIADAVPLMRQRGTVQGLRRFIELSIGVQVTMLEHFKLRGFGGPVLGYTAEDEPTRSVLGSGFRIGGAIADITEDPLTGTSLAATTRRAHRFTVIVPGTLSDDQTGILDHILQMHRPAHTIGDFCTAGAGMRTGIGLHVGLTSIIGESATFSPGFIGRWPLGRGITLGRAIAGLLPGAGQVGRDTRVG